MMPGESRSQAADTGPGSADSGSGSGPASCQNCYSLQQSLNEYVATFIALKQKIIDTDHVLAEYQKKCDELQKTERDRKTLRDQLDESLQKFEPLERCKEEMDAMRVELEEKRSSIKMYQQTHLEFSKLEQERIKNDALNKKLEMRIKKLEETTSKQNGEIKQLKKEKTALEKNLKKTQEKLLAQQKNGVKDLKDAEKKKATCDVPRIDKNKVKLLLEEIWTCIEKSGIQEKQSKGSTYSPDKKTNSQKKCRMPRKNIIDLSHSSPVEKESPPSSSLHQSKCDQEKNDQSKLDESLIDDGLKTNGEGAFYDDETVAVTKHQDSNDSPNTSSSDSEDGDDEQDALSQQLQEILYWAQPLPPQLSPLPYSSSLSPRKQSMFGNLTDSSDAEGGDLPRRSCSESFSETNQPDSSMCTETMVTDQSSTTEAGFFESTTETEKMGCTQTGTVNMNVQSVAETETGGEVPYPGLVAGGIHCRNEANTEAESLLEETRGDSEMTETPEIQSADVLPIPRCFFEEDLLSTEHSYLKVFDASKYTAVSALLSLKMMEPRHERSKVNSNTENGIKTGINQRGTENLLQETSSGGQLGPTSEGLEMEGIHYKRSTCDSQNEFTVPSVLVSNGQDPKSVDVAKGHKSNSTVGEVILLPELNNTVVHYATEDQCIPKEDMELEEVHSKDKQCDKSTQISLRSTAVELSQAESPVREQNLKIMDMPPHAESCCSMKTGISQGSFETFTSAGSVMEKANSVDSVYQQEKHEFPLNSVPTSDIEQTCHELGVKEQGRLEKMKEAAAPGSLECPVEMHSSQDESKKCVSVENKGIEKVNSSSLISGNEKNKSSVASALLNATEDSVIKKQDGLDRMQGNTVLDATEGSVIAGVAKSESKDSVCAGDVLGSTSRNAPAVSSGQEFIQQSQSSATIKEKDGLNGSVDLTSLESDGPLVANVTQNSLKHDVHIGNMGMGSNAERPKDEHVCALLSFSSQQDKVASAIMSQDFPSKAEETPPFVESNSSVSEVDVLDKKKDCTSTEEIEEVTSHRSTPSQHTVSSIQSCAGGSKTNSIIKGDDIITEAKVTSLLLVTDSSVVTDLAQDHSTEVPDKYGNKDNRSTQSKSVDVAKCTSPLDKWKDSLIEKKEMERSEMEEINNQTVKSLGDNLSSGQTFPTFHPISDESSGPNMSQNIAGQHLGQNSAESEELSNTGKKQDERFEKPLLDDGHQPIQKSGSPSNLICQVNEDLQDHEAGVSTLIQKIKKNKPRNVKTPRSTKRTEKAVRRKLVGMGTTAEIATPESQKVEPEVQTENRKMEFGQQCFSVNNHATVSYSDLPFESESIPAANKTVCNNGSITNVQELTAIHPDSDEHKTEQLTLDKSHKQGSCQTPVLHKHSSTNVNYEAAGNIGNIMSVECETSDLNNPAKEDCDSETYSESSRNNDSLGCTQIKSKHFAGYNCNHNDPADVEKSESSSEVCNVCTKEHLGIQVNNIGIAEQIPNCITSMKAVSGSTNTTLKKPSVYLPPIQKVDNSTQTELICNGSHVVLFARNNWPATSKTLSQVGSNGEDKDEITKSKSVSSLPDAASGDQVPLGSVSMHGKEVLLESTSDNSVNSKSLGTSVSDQTCMSSSNRKIPSVLADGDVGQVGNVQKSKLQSTYKRRVALRKKSKSLNPSNLSTTMNADTSAAGLCMQEIHEVMLEMGQPLPPLLPPLVATPPRTTRFTRAQSSPAATSCVASVCSPVDDMVSSKETSKVALDSSPSDHLQRKSPPVHSPSPLEFSRNERIQSSPLQFCTTTPKHAVPVPGRLPPSTSASANATLPQENSVKILDAMYPNLSARARTLNILRGNVQLSMRGGPAEGESQAGPVNQIMGFKAINSSPTAFVKAGSNSRSEGPAKDLEQEKPVDATLDATDRSTPDQKVAKRCAEDDVANRAKKLKTENNSQHEDKADLIAPDVVDVVAQTEKVCDSDVEPKSADKTELLSQPCEPVKVSEEAVASALNKITKSCFDLLPVVRSHVFVGNIPQIPVLRDEEKELISELNGNKDLTEAVLFAIFKKLKAEQSTLDGNCLQALCRVYVAICRQQGDLERARLLSYSVLKEDFPDSSKLLLLILSVWRNMISMQGPINKAMQAVAKHRAKGDILNCLSVYLNWEKNLPLDISSLISSFLVAMQQSPKVRFQTSSEYGLDFNGNMWELIYAIDLLCSQQHWAWTHDCFIRKEAWPVLDKWMKRRKGYRNVLHVQDVTVAGVMRLIGYLGQQGLKKNFLVAVQNISAIINSFLQHAFQEEVPWPVQLSAAYTVYDLAPSNPKGALEALQKWSASVTEPVPPAAKNCLTELETFCERLNFETKTTNITSNKL